MKLFSQMGFKFDDSGLLTLAGEEDFSVLQNIQTGSGGPPSLLFGGYGAVPFRWSKVVGV